MPVPLHLHGCRHDILGHYWKAIGLLRVLTKCADEALRDLDAEGWWDSSTACFCLRSPKYPTREKLMEFFEKYYQPTPFFPLWNTGGGLDEKKEIEFSIAQTSWRRFWAELLEDGVAIQDRFRPETLYRQTGQGRFGRG